MKQIVNDDGVHDDINGNMKYEEEIMIVVMVMALISEMMSLTITTMAMRTTRLHVTGLLSLCIDKQKVIR